jgi:glycosyltransferase involved in cell wall biosynthesis
VGRSTEVVELYLADTRIHYHRLEANQGLGTALNHALDQARAPLIAYLPSDDVYDADHLGSLASTLDAHPEAVLAYSGEALLRSVWRKSRDPFALLLQQGCGLLEGSTLSKLLRQHDQDPAFG